MSNLYNDPIFLKAVNNLTEEDVQFFKDIQEGKIDLKNKKELKKRYKDIQLRMVSNFNFQEIRRNKIYLQKKEENDKIRNNK